MNDSTEEIYKTKIQSLKLNEHSIDAYVFIITLVFYAITIHRGVGGVESPGNAAKFQYIGYILGVPHSPGYPLYIMINWLWSHIPFPFSIASRINLLSITFAAGALTFFRKGLLQLGTRASVSIAATIGLGLSPLFWIRATEAGPGAMTYFFVCLLLYLFFKWKVCGDSKYIARALFITFIAAFHDTTCLWFTPLLLIYITITKPKVWLNSSVCLSAAAGLVLGLGSYAFILIRSYQNPPVLEFIRLNASVSDVIKTALGAQFWPNYFFAGPGAIFSERLPQLIVDTYRQFNEIGILMVLTGLTYLLIKKHMVGIITVLSISAAFLFRAHLFSANITSEYWLFFLIAAYCIGIGIEAVWKLSLKYGMIVSVMYILLTVLFSFTNNNNLLFRQNKWDAEKIFLACPENSQLVTDDYYNWREVLRYHKFTDPFIRERKINLCEQLNLLDGSTNLFFSESVRKQLDALQVPYVPIFSSDNSTLYIIGVKQTSKSVD